MLGWHFLRDDAMMERISLEAAKTEKELEEHMMHCPGWYIGE